MCARLRNNLVPYYCAGKDSLAFSHHGHKTIMQRCYTQTNLIVPSSWYIDSGYMSYEASLLKYFQWLELSLLGCNIYSRRWGYICFSWRQHSTRIHSWHDKLLYVGILHSLLGQQLSTVAKIEVTNVLVQVQ